MYSRLRLQKFHQPIVNNFGETFHLAISIPQQQKLFFFNTVWQNTIYSITNKGIDLKIHRDMHWSMAHIFIILYYSGKCLFIGAIFNFPRQGMSGPTR